MSSERFRTTLLCVATMFMVAYFLAVVAPSTSYTIDTSSSNNNLPALTPAPPIPEDDTNNNQQPEAPQGEDTTPSPPSPGRSKNAVLKSALPSWGYNADRNAKRWAAIQEELLADNPNPETAMVSVVDYGADQGYFTVSTSRLLPKAVVIAVEMGGTGGSIWEKKGSALDVLKVIEDKAAQHARGGGNVVICKTKADPSQWTQLNDNNLRHNYQFVLSVFHWFDLPTRESFEVAITHLFRNARTTFIELPTAGDGGALIQKQVGYKNFKEWYAGRTDLGEVMKTAAKNNQVEVEVKLIASLRWLKWTRDVYRVDVVETTEQKERKLNCDLHLKIYDCAVRERHAACPKNWIHE